MINLSNPYIKYVAIAATLVVILTIIVIVILLYPFGKPSGDELPDVTEPLPPSNSPLGEFTEAAVVANGKLCADIGRDILKAGGKAVDAMIGTMLCDGISMPSAMGIGGGFVMVIYDRQAKKSFAVNAREVAPLAATKEMFKDNPEKSAVGGLAVAVPGEIKGYRAVYEKFGGGVPWKRLFEPSIKLCKEGISISHGLERAIIISEKFIRPSKLLSALFVDRKTGDLLKYGDKYTNPKLAETLKIISEEPYALYNGSLAALLVTDIKNAGGIITLADLEGYKERSEDELLITPIKHGSLNLHTLKPPTSGVILSFILRLVDDLLPAPSDVLNIHRITEAFKFGYGARSKLGDPKFLDLEEEMKKLTSEEEIARVRKLIDDNKTYNDSEHYGAQYSQSRDYGTAAMSVIAPNGDAVSATSTINLYFGSKMVSASTGIILNNEMDDFSSFTINAFGVTPSESNLIAPGKRPMSSMCPSIIINENGDVVMTVGAAGGTRITTSVALVIIRTLIFNATIKEAIDHALFHHQLAPMIWDYEYGMLKNIVEGMHNLGHHVLRLVGTQYTCLNGIHKKDNTLYVNSDYRRLGSVSGF